MPVLLEYLDENNWWGIHGVFHNRCGKFIIEWYGLMKGRKRKKLRRLILGCVIWSLWYERNKTKFEMSSPEFHNFVHTLKIRVGIWAKEILGCAGFSPQDFIHNIDAILL